MLLMSATIIEKKSRNNNTQKERKSGVGLRYSDPFLLTPRHTHRMRTPLFRPLLLTCHDRFTGFSLLGPA
ncbi:hypothetical protein YC2023_047212 [Brassica napus]